MAIRIAPKTLLTAFEIQACLQLKLQECMDELIGVWHFYTHIYNLTHIRT